jgi:hypothetical protein
VIDGWRWAMGERWAKLGRIPTAKRRSHARCGNGRPARSGLPLLEGSSAGVRHWLQDEKTGCKSGEVAVHLKLGLLGSWVCRWRSCALRVRGVMCEVRSLPPIVTQADACQKQARILALSHSRGCRCGNSSPPGRTRSAYVGLSHMSSVKACDATVE